MELKIQESIYKNRSHASCLKTAYETLLSNLWPVFKYVWPFALFYAFCAMMNGVLNTSLRVDAFQNIVNIDTIVMTVVCLLLTIVADIMLTARIFTMLNKEKLLRTTWRYVKSQLTIFFVVFILSAAITAIIYAIVGNEFAPTPRKFSYIYGYVMVLTLVISLFSLPYAYGFMRYMSERECVVVDIIGKDYINGVRYYGFIFIVMLLSAILLGIVFFVIAMPSFVISTAELLSDMGKAMLGDQPGLPSYFKAMQVVTYALTGFLMMFLRVYFILVIYYMYGTITERIRIKKEMKG